MKKRGKTVELTLNIVMPSTCAKFSCRGAWTKVGSARLWNNHKLRESTTLTVCPESYCQAMTCSEHTQSHQEWHVMEKLGGAVV